MCILVSPRGRPCFGLRIRGPTILLLILGQVSSTISCLDFPELETLQPAIPSCGVCTVAHNRDFFPCTSPDYNS